MMNVLSLEFQSKAIKLSLSFPLIERSRWDTEGYCADAVAMNSYLFPCDVYQKIKL